MPRLSVLDSDADQWGALLNEFLRVLHHEAGTLCGCCPIVNVHDFGAIGE